MDIFSHGLWAGAAAKAVNNATGSSTLTEEGKNRKLHVWRTILWGIFPDLFAFAPAFIWLFWLIASGQMTFAEWPGPAPHAADEPMGGNSAPALQLAGILYNFSHSIIIFFLIFSLVWLVRRRIVRNRKDGEGLAASVRQSADYGGPKWEMGGWLLHILMDIPTHSYAFFPTPVFWPVFGWKFDGFNWATPWFLMLNYGLLILVYWLLRDKNKGLSRGQ